MNAIALCHNRDLQKTNGRIIVLGTGSVFSDSHLSEYAIVLAVKMVCPAP